MKIRLLKNKVFQCSEKYKIENEDMAGIKFGGSICLWENFASMNLFSRSNLSAQRCSAY